MQYASKFYKSLEYCMTTNHHHWNFTYSRLLNPFEEKQAASAFFRQYRLFFHSKVGRTVISTCRYTLYVRILIVHHFSQTLYHAKCKIIAPSSAKEGDTTGIATERHTLLTLHDAFPETS